MMTDHHKTILSAQVVLYPDDRLGEGDARDCEHYFRDGGFELGSRFAGSFSITAPLEQFEQVFGCSIVTDDHGTHVETDTAQIEFALPLAALPDHLRRCISAVTFTAPPDFGPTNY